MADTQKQKDSGEEGVYRGTKEIQTIVRLRGISKTYWRGKEAVKVLENLDLEVPDGAFEALMGPSGSGKTTLLNLMAGLDRPSSGGIEVAGHDLTKLSDAALAKFRSRNIGFIFQQYNLMPVLTALQNVELPLLLTKLSGAERKKRAQTALRIVGLEDRMSHYPRQMSGGQEQRVAIARAIVSDPKIIVADEPTGDLDRENANEILNLLERLNHEFKKTIVMVTHDPRAAGRAHVQRQLAPAHGVQYRRVLLHMLVNRPCRSVRLVGQRHQIREPAAVDVVDIKRHIKLGLHLGARSFRNRQEVLKLLRSMPIVSLCNVGHYRDCRATNLIAKTKVL